ncbi:MAG: CvpA family protein [Bacteroidota bacterium]|nr:CvpA family protein [Bacteroidota bacterium]
MIIDIIFAILMVLAIIKGFQRGFIVAIFSMIAFVIGLAAAIKLSAVVAAYIGQSVKISDKWLPVISFIVVFIIVILLVRIGAKLIEKTFQVAMLGWLNRLSGVLLYAALYTFIYSVVLFYAEHMQLLKPATIHGSVTYSYIQPLGPKVIDAIGAIIPIFKNMFTGLENFFDHISGKISKP